MAPDDGEDEATDPMRGGAYYVKSSLRVWQEEVVRLGDHKLVTCRLELEDWKQVQQPQAIPAGRPEPVLGWRRRDGGDREFWDKLVAAGESKLQQWLEGMQEEPASMNVDRFLEGYKERLDEALEIGVGRRRKKKSGKTKH